MLNTHIICTFKKGHNGNTFIVPYREAVLYLGCQSTQIDTIMRVLLAMYVRGFTVDRVI